MVHVLIVVELSSHELDHILREFAVSGPENGATILLVIFDGDGAGGPTGEFDERMGTGIERIRGTRERCETVRDMGKRDRSV